MLTELDRFLQVRDLEQAHGLMIRFANWFYPNRKYLPDGFNNVWYVLRARVNRLYTMLSWNEPWVEREVLKLLDKTTPLIGHAQDVLETLAPMPAYEDYSVREMSAPSATGWCGTSSARCKATRALPWRAISTGCIRSTA